MKLQLVPARRGALWVRQGFEVFFARPFAYSGLFGVLLLAMLVAQVLPWIGPLLFLACLPLATLGFMLATQQVLQGQFPLPRVFVAPLRGDRPRATALWQLGLIYAVLMLIVTGIRMWIDGGRTDALQEAMSSGKATPESLAALLSDGRLQLSLMWFGGMAGLLSLPFWHAPALVHWDGQPVGKALFFSCVACWRNKAAFAVYGLAWVAVVLGFALASSMLFALLGQPQWAAMVMIPAALVFSTVFYASLFFTFVDCFERPPAPGAAPEIAE